MSLALMVLGLFAAPAQEPARLVVEPRTVEVGEPFRLALDASLPAGVPFVAPDELELGPAWVLLGEERSPSYVDPDQPDRRRHRYAWRLGLLEPGSHAPPEPLLRHLLELGLEVEPDAARVEVLGVLAAEEDEPRPLRGFPQDFVPSSATAAAPAWLVPAVAAGALALVVACAVWLVRRRSHPTTTQPTLEERLATLREEARGGLDACLASHFALVHLVRESTEERLERAARPGLTDEEWLASLAGESALVPEASAELAAFLERCAEVKYGGRAPTEWALEETLRAAETLIRGGSAARQLEGVA